MNDIAGGAAGLVLLLPLVSKCERPGAPIDQRLWKKAVRIAETTNQAKLTKTPISPAKVSKANGSPNLSGFESGSHEAQPQIPGKHTDDPITIAPTEIDKAMAGRFIVHT